MNILCFDTETTGLINNYSKKLDMQPEVIEFAAQLVHLDTGEISFKCDELFKPTHVLPSVITKITGITEEILRDKPYIHDKVEWIAKIISNADAVVAHNASFDKAMINFEMQRYQEKIEWPRVICTVEQTIHIRGYRLKLRELHEYLFGTVFADAHRASSDVDALVRCCIELNKRGMLL